MRTYTVWKYPVATPGGSSVAVSVEADDVDVETEGEGPDAKVYYNFTAEDGDVTVAVFPFKNVEYVTSQPK